MKAAGETAAQKCTWALSGLLPILIAALLSCLPCTAGCSTSAACQGMTSGWLQVPLPFLAALHAQLGFSMGHSRGVEALARLPPHQQAQEVFTGLSLVSLPAAGVCALRGSASGMARVAKLTLGYYTLCTAAAVALGIVLVTVIQPGQGSPLSGGSVTSCHTPDLKVRCPPSSGLRVWRCTGGRP